MVTAFPVEPSAPGPGMLPVALTPLLGRERELAALRDLLLDDGVRVVTLLGPGGVGKTRLALAAAHRLAAEELEPLFVPASHLRTGDELLAEMARLLGLRERAGASLASQLARAIGEAALLALLDNLEQIPDAGRPLAPLLAACPGLLLLATSRVPLHISGERRFPVAPLPVEAVAGEPAAVALFVARVRDVRPEFALTPEVGETVTAICRRLDGLPLAIELAAARCGVLSPAALLARLTNHLGVLRGRDAGVPERQQTLQALVEWSYALLPEPTRAVFRRLSAVPDGFDLALAAAVAETDEDAILPEIETLVEHSLLFRSDGADDARFGMLQTIRDAALALAEQVELDAARDRFAHAVAAVAPALRAGLAGPDAAVWRNRCAADHPIFVAASERLLATGRKAEVVALSGALWRFWYHAGGFGEGVALLERAVALPGEVEPGLFANATNGIGALRLALGELAPAGEAFAHAAETFAAAGDGVGAANAENNRALVLTEQGAYERAIAAYERAIAAFAALGEIGRLASAEDNLGLVVQKTGDLERAAELHARALAAHRLAGNEDGMATAAHHLAGVRYERGELDEAERQTELALGIWEAEGNVVQLPFGWNTLGNIASRRGELGLAVERYERALAIAREHAQADATGLALFNLGVTAVKQGRTGDALTAFRDSLLLRVRRGDPDDLAYVISGIAGVSLEVGDAERATRLAAAAHALREEAGLAHGDDPRPELRRALGKARFAAAWKSGLAMDLPAVLAETELVAARETPHSPVRDAPSRPSPISTASTADHGLTERELDVLRLIAAGKTNAEIGEALFISPFTAKTHVANVLGKLGVETRAAASTWAAQHGLLAGA